MSLAAMRPGSDDSGSDDPDDPAAHAFSTDWHGLRAATVSNTATYPAIVTGEMAGEGLD